MVKELPDFVIPDEGPARAESVVALVAQTVPEFAGATLADCTVSVLSGGITNQLCRVKHNELDRSVVVRIFGKQTERLISREAEEFWQRLFLKTFARVANGLVYEFLENHVPLEPNECGEHAEQIARDLAQLHQEAAKKSMFVAKYSNQSTFQQVVMRDWMREGTSEEALSRIAARGHDVAAIFGDLALFKQHAKKLNDALNSVAHLVPIVPCHNDLLSLNIMLSRETRRLRFIDFEYMRRNFYLADIANHFCEFAGFECEWSQYPDEATQRRFLRAYLAEALDPAAHSAEDIQLAEDRGMKLLPLFALMAHYVWASWALVQGAYSVIEFDYVAFGGRRFKRYLETCEEAYSLAAQVLFSKEAQKELE